MKVTCYIYLQLKKNERNQVPFVIFITIIELFGLNEARRKVQKKLKTKFACIGTVTFARKVNVTMFILMKIDIFICRDKHEGIANVESYRDIQGQTMTDKDNQGNAWTDRDK